MKASTFLPLGLLVVPTIAFQPRHQLKRSLEPRQSCLSGSKVCGDYCILSSYTCCPDRQGGCRASQYCSLGDNGEYGCCDDGEVCTGDGGVTMIGTYEVTSTSTYRNTGTITSYRQSSTPAANEDPDGDNLSWRTYTVTYDDGDRAAFTYAIYDGDGVVTESDQLRWTTRTITDNDSDPTVQILASETPEPLPFTDTYIDYTTTRDWALYNGGYVTNSAELDWSTTVVTLSNGGVTTATFASVPNPDSSDTRDAVSTTSRSSSSSRTSVSTPQETRTTGSATAIIAQPTGNSAASSIWAGLRCSTWLRSSTVVAVTMFIAMVWL